MEEEDGGSGGSLQRDAPTAAGGPSPPPPSRQHCRSLPALVLSWQWLLDGLTSSVMALSTITYTYLLLHAASFGPTYMVAAAPASAHASLGQGGAASVWVQEAMVYSTS